MDQPKSLPMQTDEFVDLELEDGTILTAEERKKAADKVGYKEPTEVMLPVGGKLVSEFCEETALILKEEKTIFYRPASREVLEIGMRDTDDGDDQYMGFIQLRAERFITVAEKYIIPYVPEKKKDDEGEPYFINKPKSMTSSLSNTVLASPNLQENLPIIKRIFQAPMPCIYNGELIFPRSGYDERLKSWMPLDAPKIDKDMKLEEAKEIIHKVYGEFCFKSRQDYMNAISGLLTPFLRGLFPSFSTRSPLFLYVANRERAGKDYCAGITGLVHEGFALEDPAICSGERNSNNNEELRKKILSAMIAGRKRMHFANNKGFIDNAILEGFLTSERHSDRALGRNEILTFDNEMDISASGNVGIGFTADLANRTRFINLFLDIEDANSRSFNNPNLHEYVRNNRGLILSALYALVRNWFNKGRPIGSIPFTSFPEWARTCGGIMESAGYDSPCQRDEEALAVGGDIETTDMKALFEKCYEERPDKWFSKSEITMLVKLNQDDMFGYIDFSKKADQTAFGKKLSKFAGRIFSNILMKVQDASVRPSRQNFMFTLEKGERNKDLIFNEIGKKNSDVTTLDSDFTHKTGNIGNFGNICSSSCIKDINNNSVIGAGSQSATNVANVATMAKEHGFTDEQIKEAGWSEE